MTLTLKEIIAEIDRLAEVAARFDLFKLEERLAAVAANLNDIVEEQAADAEYRKDLVEEVWQNGRKGLIKDLDKEFELPPAQPVPVSPWSNSVDGPYQVIPEKEEGSIMPGTGFAGRSLGRIDFDEMGEL